ncbi:UDP-N-acetylenolpyruvoylglucosamine reductase [Listeria monocytogenes]|nr:UDP-N-acetylenolpyruvoylglucosamine reductase [Listeria monocytogenes]
MNNLQTKFPHIAIKLNEPLSKYTYTKTGGAADVFVMPKTIEEAQEVVTVIKIKFRLLFLVPI